MIPRSVTMYAICNIRLFKVSHEIQRKTTLRLGDLRNGARAAIGISLLSETAGCAKAYRLKIVGLLYIVLYA